MPEFIEQAVPVIKNKPDLKSGMLVEIRPWQEIQAEASEGLIDCGWNPHMRSLSGKQFYITDDMYNRYVRDDSASITEISDYYISASMLKVVDENTTVEQPKITNEYSLRNDEQDSEIIAEMIKKVDRIRFKKLLCIASCDRSITVKTISDTIVDKYLTNWAKAKYDIYLLFGKQLSLSKQIETSIDDDTMRNKVKELQYAFPQYANLLGSFSLAEFINNRCDGSNYILGRFYDKYTGNVKLSKLLTGLISDKSFNDALAMFFGTTTIKAVASLSIDPYDYMTISVNRYDWTTCQRIGDSDAPYATGAGSIMLDTDTIIAFAHSGKDVMYHMNEMEFSGNSKFWRQAIYLDKDSGNFITSREYPSQKELLAKEARTFMEDTIADYLNIHNQWMVKSLGGLDYNEGSQNLYHDILNDFPYSVVRIKGSDKLTSVKVGKNVFCLQCGKAIKGHQGRYICDDDYDSDNNFDDYDEEHEEEDIPF